MINLNSMEIVKDYLLNYAPIGITTTKDYLYLYTNKKIFEFSYKGEG